MLDIVIQRLPLQVLLPLELDRYCLRLLQGIRMREDLIDGMGGRPHDCRSACSKKTGKIAANPVFVEPGLLGANAKPLEKPGEEILAPPGSCPWSRRKLTSPKSLPIDE